MMKTRNLLLFVALPLILIAGAAGFFLYDKFAGPAMTDSIHMVDATSYDSGPFQVTVRINPETPRVGDNQFAVRVEDAQGNPVTGANIRAYGEMAAMATMPAMRTPADMKEVQPGMYTGSLNLEMSGEWPLSLTIQKTGIGETRLGFDMATGRRGLSISSGGTPVANARRKTNNKDSVSMQANDMLASSTTPTPDDEGFYLVGKYKVKVESTSGAFESGENDIIVSVSDLDGNRISDADIRAVAQRLDETGHPQANTPVIHFTATANGIYHGTLTLTQGGEYTLAVDVTSGSMGHGDLILTFNTSQTGAMSGLKAATATPEGIAYYTCSMHSSVREAGPGQCPICSMDLVPVTNEEVQSGTFSIDARRRQLIGVQTGKAIYKNLTKTIRAVGQVGYDERLLSNVTLKFDAWIGDLKADYVGARVERGQMLFSVYSPELLSAQQEYLESRQRLSSRGSDDSLVRAARKRLMLWDISPGQVEALERRGQPLEYLPIFAPKSGTVVEKMVVEGSYMNTGDTLLRIADLSSVWIDAEVYEADLALIKEGMAASVSLPYLPEQTYQAKVDYVYPYMESKTRTARIRVVLDNPQGTLKPDMYAEVKLQADLGERLVVPEEAVLVAGESRVVFVDMGEDGKLKPVKVKTGQHVGGFIEVTEGLSAGDIVITSGNFLIAAEAKLKTGINQW